MSSKLMLVMKALLAMALFIAPAAVASDVNQGDQNLVLRVDNEAVSCDSPTPGSKVQGGLGRTISFSTEDPIDFVTVKSGDGAGVVSAELDTFSGTITLSKDVSNYVVWTCLGEEGSGGEEGDGGGEGDGGDDGTWIG